MRVSVGLLAVALAAGGCQPPPAPQPTTRSAPGIVWRAAKAGLAVEVVVPETGYARGDVIPVAVTARNTTAEEMTVTASTRAKVLVSILQSTPIGWEEIGRYPGAAATVLTTWTLAPGQTFTHTMNVPVTADWPTDEPLKLEAWLDGRPDVRPGGIIRVYPTGQQPDR